VSTIPHGTSSETALRSDRTPVTGMIGRQVSHFYVIRNLGSGGMGIVYEAQDMRLARSVALKFLKPSLSKNLDAVRRFKREARLASSLNHPNICTILDVDEIDGQSFIAMELLQGESLKARLASGAASLDDMLDIGTQIAGALGVAHEQGIMHRDITPGNIFITAGGPAKLLDFGLAKHFAVTGDDTVTDELTEPGTVAGTIHYMAPEQFLEGVKVDYRADLYSFGAVLYQMATGARPFEAKSRHDVMALIQDQPHVPLSRLAPHHPVQLEHVVEKLLAKAPADRYDSAWALRDALQAIKKRGLRSAAPANGSARLTSIAVLPFSMIGGSGRYGTHFQEGLAQDISSRLSHLPGVRVAPRTSTSQVATASISEIGAQLHVDMVLEGTVQQAEGSVRVTANLIHAANEQPVLPAIRVERQFESLFTVQDDIAREVVTAIAPALRGADRRRTQDAEAYTAFKRGQHHWKSCFSGGWQPAIEQFQYAVERDPRFPLAHLALGVAYNFLGFYCLMKPSVAFRIARGSIERALEIDDSLPAAHAELGLMKFGGEWDWDGSEQAFRRALELEPGNAIARTYYSWLLVMLGREDAAFTEGRRAYEEGATASRFIAAGWAQTLYLARQYDEAIAACNECLAGDADFAFGRHLRGQCFEMKAMYPEAIVDLEASVALTHRSPFHIAMLGHCYGKAGRAADALNLITELDRQSREMYVPPQSYVYIYAGLGKAAKALEYQDKAYEDGASPFNYLTPNIRELYALDLHHKSRLEQMRLKL